MQQIFEFLGNLPTGHFTIGALRHNFKTGESERINELESKVEALTKAQRD